MKFLLGLLLGTWLLCGCAGGLETGAIRKPATTEPVARAPAAAPQPATNPVVLLGATGVAWSDLAPRLSESAGAEIVEEWCLEHLLERELRFQGKSISDADLSNEKDLLVETLAREAGVAPDQGEQLVLEIRRTRGLGERRFASLLRRNAMLRQLVAAQVQVTPEDLRQAYDIRHGPRFQTRLLLVASERDAAEALRQLRDGPRTPAHFGQVAASVSIDRSQLRAGQIGEVSPADPSFPLGIRSILTGLKEGAFSDPISLEQGFAIVMVERAVPAPAEAPTLETATSALEREVRLVRERALMEKTAARLLRSAEITVLDPSLSWSWDNRREGQSGGAP